MSKVIKASVVIGGSISGSLKGALATTKAGLSDIGKEIAKVEMRQRLLARGVDNYRRMGVGADGLAASYTRLAQHADRLRAAQARLESINSRIAANDERRQAAGGKLRGAVGVFAVAAAATVAPIRSAIEFENSMLGVAKQLEGARDAAGNLTPVFFSMAKNVRILGREIPIATNEIADMVAAGLRMGVAGDQVVKFTRTAAMMADAFEMPAGQLADDMGKIAGLFHIPIPKIGDLADAINYLDDNSIAKGGDIIDVMRRIGGMAETLKMPAKEAAALGSTFLHLGSSAEVAATASNAVMRILGTATAQSKRVRTGLDSIGLSPAAVQASMAANPTKTIEGVLKALNALNREQRIVAATRIFGAEYGDDIAKLATGAEEYRRQLDLATGAAAQGSVSREFQARLKTTGAQWQLTKNRMKETAVVVGESLTPAITDLFKSLAPVITASADWAAKNPALVKGVVGATLAVTGLRVAIFGLSFATAVVKTPVLALLGRIAAWRAANAVAGVTTFGGALMRLGLVARAVGVAMALGALPLTLIVGALTVGGLIVRKYWEPISAWVVGFGQGIATGVAPALSALGVALDGLSPVFRVIGNAVRSAWGWFTKLLTPVKLTKGEFDGATASGKNFGQVVGAAIGWVIGRVTQAVNLFGKMKAGLGGLVKFAAGVMGPAAPIAELAIAGVRATAGRSPPALPAAAGGRGFSAVAAAAPTYNITQLPGESGEDLARRIEQHRTQREGVQRRGSLVDAAG